MSSTAIARTSSSSATQSLSLPRGQSEGGLVHLATPVLELILQLKAGQIAASQNLRGQLDAMLKEFERQSDQAGYREAAVQEVKFALAAFADETVLTNDFPLRDQWEKNPLQLEYFGEHLAGVKFFERLD